MTEANPAIFLAHLYFQLLWISQPASILEARDSDNYIVCICASSCRSESSLASYLYISKLSSSGVFRSIDRVPLASPDVRHRYIPVCRDRTPASHPCAVELDGNSGTDLERHTFRRVA